MKGRPNIIWEPGIESLCIAVVRQAIADYEKAKGVIERTSQEETQLRNAKALKRECERFFLGSWFSCICEIDGAALLRRINEGGLSRNG